MKRKILVSLMILAAMIMTACGGTATSDIETDGASGTTTGVSSEQKDPRDIDDGLPDTDFDRREFRILTYEMLVDDYIADTENGGLINDAVFHRNRAVEERFGVTINTTNGGSNAAVKDLTRSSILSGDYEYDLVINHMIDTANLAVTGVYSDFNDIKYIDPSKPWWNKSVTENLSIGGKVWLMIGDISPYFLEHDYVVYFNKRLTAEYDISESDLYMTAKDGKWTIDKYASLTKDIWRDLNGNNERDDDDLYGLTAQVTSYATPFIYSFGETTVKKDKDDMPVLAINEEKCAAITEKIYNLLYNQQGTLPSNNWTLHNDTYMDGRAVFMNGVLTHAVRIFTDVEDDYGILPYPKWDENQSGYYTMSDGSSPLIAVPKTVKDTDFVGMITEAMAAESYKQVTPVIYDIALKVRGARDEESLEVIDLATRSGVVDFGFVFGDYSMMGFFLSNLMETKKDNFASYYASRKDKWEKRVNDIIETAESEGALG